MKRNIYVFAFLLIGFVMNSQTFWTEDFGINPVCGTVSAAAYTGTNGAWTTSLTGTNQSLANEWYVSPKEAGMGVGNCGDGCDNNPILINRTLHISTSQSFLGDQGATYYAGSFGNTDVRAESPIINCTGKSGIAMSFNYFVVGVVNQDYCEMMFSANGGLTWSTLGIAPQTTLGACSPQGKWASFSVALPATANNNANVKVGFRWQNINATGADPCIALDDIALSTPSASSLTPTFSLQTSICKGDSTQVTANTGTNVASGYTWTALPAGPIIAAPNASVTYIKFPTTGNFTITLTATSGTMVGSVSHTITVNPTPTVTATSSTNTVCSGKTATLTASGGLSYTWTPGSSTLNPVVVTPTASTNYQVVGTNTFGCKGYGFVNINVIPLPTVAISSSTMNVCTGSTATLTASGASTYSWAPITASSAVVVISPTAASTTYTVVGTSSAGCTNTNTITITTSTCSGGSSGLNAYALNQLPFNVFPNPAKDKITIKAGDVNLNNVKVEMFEVVGKKLYEQNFSSLPAGTEQSIQISNLPKGIFILSMSVDGIQQKAIRLVKE